MASQHALPEAHIGVWPWVKATVRPLEEWERPASGDVADDRMVVYAVGGGSGMLALAWEGVYAPLSRPGLLADYLRLFGRTRRPRNSQLIRFYGQYGPLHLPLKPEQERPHWAERLTPANQRKLGREARLGLCEPAWWLRRHGREVARAYQLYRALAEDDLRMLRELLPAIGSDEELVRYGWQEGEITTYVREARAAEDDGPRKREGAGSALADDECRHWARLLLADRLTEGERTSHLGWHEIREGQQDELVPEVLTGVPRLVRGRSFDSLLAAMYVQLGRLVWRGEELQTCEGCGGWYYSTHGGQKYCEPHCADASRRREARKAAQEERSLL